MKRLCTGVLALCLGALPATALAEATVKVQLRGPEGQPADGLVQLEQGENKHACKTEQGTCQITGVKGGLYTVTVTQPGKKPPKPKQVMIPPAGEVSLIVRGGS